MALPKEEESPFNSVWSTPHSLAGVRKSADKENKNSLILGLQPLMASVGVRKKCIDKHIEKKVNTEVPLITLPI